MRSVKDAAVKDAAVEGAANRDAASDDGVDTGGERDGNGSRSTQSGQPPTDPPSPIGAGLPAKGEPASPGPTRTTSSALGEHGRRVERHAAELEKHEGALVRWSMAQLATFVAAGILVAAGISQNSPPWTALGTVCLGAFVATRVWHIRIQAKRDLARIRRDIHRRHLARLGGAWQDLPSTGEGLLSADHAYAHDIDLLGPGSLFQRVDVTHTAAGEASLAAWLGAPASEETIRQRQEAVRELAANLDFRQELEAAAELAQGSGKLDGGPFLRFTQQASFFDQRGYLPPLMVVLPLLSLAAIAGAMTGVLPTGVWLLPILLQAGLWMGTTRAAAETFDMAAARRGFAEAFNRMLVLAEGHRPESVLLREMQQRLTVKGKSPSAQLRRLDRWLGMADLRTQFPLHFPANLLCLWDLHVLRGLERWKVEIGAQMPLLFATLGELEALSSLATLVDPDGSTVFPEIGAAKDGMAAEDLAHPLLPVGGRVANDVSLGGRGHALIVTGSNMAGKSTLLRAVGVSTALALAGGPVCARAFRVPRSRLRASMRADDSLQRGASYFHAELMKLRGVVADAADDPPILFLLDELLRGTNARARHIGARAVLLHLIERGAMGMVATHDVALARLEDDLPAQVHNAHFTDVMIDGEMSFDYRLRPGVVRTSNALKLLVMAGIDVPDVDLALVADDAKALESPPD